MKSLSLIFFFYVALPLTLFAEKVEIKMSPIDHSSLADYNFSREAYLNYQKAFIDSLNAFFSKQDIRQNVKIVQTFSPTQYPYYGFTAKPVLSDSTRHALQKKLMSLTAINSLYLPYSTAFLIAVNGGNPKRGLDYSPILEKPIETRRKPFETYTLKESFDAIQNWTIEGAIPILVQVMNQKPDALKSILDTYTLTTEQLIKMENTRRSLFLLDAARDFIETPQLIPVLKTLLLASEGKFSYSKTYMQFIYQYEAPESLLRYLLDELSWRLNYYFINEHQIISQGTTKQLDALLEINPMSQEAIYEKIDKEMSPLISIYPHHELRKRYEQANPMYTIVLPSVNRTEAYENYLRELTSNFFIDAESFENDFPRYAEIALELGNYEFAKDCYWMLLRDSDFEEVAPPIGRESELKLRDDALISFYQFRYEYAVSKLFPSLEQSKQKEKQFKRLDKKIRKLKKKHSVYKKYTP